MTGVMFGGVEPAGGMIVAQPFGHKNRVIRRAIGLLQKKIHGVRSFSHVVVVDSLDANEVRIPGPGPQDILVRECQ
jgi:hypothetical protein